MCAVSYVGDYFRDTWPKKNNGWEYVEVNGPTRYEFNKLKEEVEALRDLVESAKKYDEVLGEPDCEIDDKVERIRKVAKHFGVEIDL